VSHLICPPLIMGVVKRSGARAVPGGRRPGPVAPAADFVDPVLLVLEAVEAVEAFVAARSVATARAAQAAVVRIVYSPVLDGSRAMDRLYGAVIRGLLGPSGAFGRHVVSAPTVIRASDAEYATSDSDTDTEEEAAEVGLSGDDDGDDDDEEEDSSDDEDWAREEDPSAYKTLVLEVLDCAAALLRDFGAPRSGILSGHSRFGMRLLWQLQEACTAASCTVLFPVAVPTLFEAVSRAWPSLDNLAPLERYYTQLVHAVKELASAGAIAPLPGRRPMVYSVLPYVTSPKDIVEVLGQLVQVARMLGRPDWVELARDAPDMVAAVRAVTTSLCVCSWGVVEAMFEDVFGHMEVGGALPLEFLCGVLDRRVRKTGGCARASPSSLKVLRVLGQLVADDVAPTVTPFHFGMVIRVLCVTGPQRVSSGRSGRSVWREMEADDDADVWLEVAWAFLVTHLDPRVVDWAAEGGLIMRVLDPMCHLMGHSETERRYIFPESLWRAIPAAHRPAVADLILGERLFPVNAAMMVVGQVPSEETTPAYVPRPINPWQVQGEAAAFLLEVFETAASVDVAVAAAEWAPLESCAVAKEGARRRVAAAHRAADVDAVPPQPQPAAEVAGDEDEDDEGGDGGRYQKRRRV